MAYPFDGNVYDEIAHRFDDVQFCRELVEQADGPVLELGIGTGRLALPLAPRSVEYHGVDAEPSMIAAARAKLENISVPVVLHTGSFIDLNLDREFALVFIPANTISHVVHHGEAERFFRGVRRHTITGGRFVLDTFNPRPSEASGRRRIFCRYRDPITGREVTVWTTPRYDHSTQVVTHALEYWRDDAEFDSRELHQRIYYPAELAAWLRWAGFAHLVTLGAYDRSPLEWDSTRLIMIAS